MRMFVAARLGLCAAMAFALLQGPPPARSATTGELLEPAPSYSGEKLSLNFQHVEVRALLQLLADFSHLNIVVSDAVSGSMSLRLKDVPWDQALDIILRSRSLTARRQGDVLHVAPRAEWAAREQADLEARRRLEDLEPLNTEAFQLNYTRAEELARGLLGFTVGPSPAAAGMGGPGYGGAPGGGYPGPGSYHGSPWAGGGYGSNHPPSTHPYRGSHAGPDPWHHPGSAWGASGLPWPSSRVLSARGSAMAVVRTNQLFVTDTASRLKTVQALIARIDIPVKQVMIEARIVEAQDNFGQSLGVRLGLHEQRQQGLVPGFPMGGVAGGQARVAVGGNYNAVSGQTGQLALDPGNASTVLARQADSRMVNLPASPVQNADPASLALSIFSPSAQRFLNIELSALEADGRGRVVSSPRIVTADQVEASISQGARIPFQKSTSSGATAVEFIEASLRLRVTPQITPEGHIIMTVAVNKDSPGTLTPLGREINIKEIRTQVLVEDGGTAVVGGIYDQDESEAQARVPLLGEAPLLGALFRNRSKESRRTELLVFLTPRVIADKTRP